MPSHALALAFARQSQPLYDRIIACKRESRALVALRDSLLPKLLCGDIRVPETEKLVESAV